MLRNALQSLRSGVRAVDEQLEKAREVLNELLRVEIVRGILLEDVSLSSGANVINHRLGAKVRGWVVIRKNANEDVWEPAKLDNSDKQIQLDASGGVIVTLWVF